MILQQRRARHNIIEFRDPEVKRICVELWGGFSGGTASAASRVGSRKVKGVPGELTYQQAASVTSIAVNDFNDTDIREFTELRHFTLLADMYQGTFWRCTSLEEISIPPSLKRIIHQGFLGCTALKRVNISDWDAWLDIAFGQENSNPVLYAKHLYLNGVEVSGNVVIPSGRTTINALTLSNLPNMTGVTIPESVTTIKGSAFLRSGLTSVTIPESVTTIEGSAFSSCASLVEAHLPSGLTVLNAALFGSCGNLESVNIPEGVTTIGPQVFYDCFKFKHVEFPSTVTSIGYNCFYRVTITELVMHAVVPPSLSNGGLGNGSSAKAIYVPDESVEAYKTADGWSRYASVVKPMSERPVGGGNCVVLTLVPSVGERRAA